MRLSTEIFIVVIFERFFGGKYCVIFVFDYVVEW